MGALITEETPPTTDGTDSARYLTSPLGVAAVSTAATTPVVQYVQADGQGNTALITRPTAGGAPVCGESYDPWGNGSALGALTQCTDDVTTNSTGYRGGVEDAATETYQWGSRSYDPKTGTWLQPDTFQAPEGANDLSIGTDPVTANRYSYVNGDPVNFVDPSGHDPDSSAAIREQSQKHCKQSGCRAVRGGNGGDGPGFFWLTDPTDYDDAELKQDDFEVTPRPGYGQLTIGLFISSENSGLAPSLCTDGIFGSRMLGFCSTTGEGDDREFTPWAHPSSNRVYVFIDFEEGEGYIIGTPSCQPDGGCENASDWASDFSTASSWFSRLPGVTDTSEYSIVDNPSALTVRMSATNSLHPVVSPAIDRTYSFTFGEDGRVVLSDDSGDSYPSAEIYQFQDWGSGPGSPSRPLLLQDEKRIINLAG